MVGEPTKRQRAAIARPATLSGIADRRAAGIAVTVWVMIHTAFPYSYNFERHIFGHAHGTQGVVRSKDTLFTNAALLGIDGDLNQQAVVSWLPRT
jgi:hypothetical protein